MYLLLYTCMQALCFAVSDVSCPKAAGCNERVMQSDLHAVASLQGHAFPPPVFDSYNSTLHILQVDSHMSCELEWWECMALERG